MTRNLDLFDDRPGKCQEEGAKSALTSSFTDVPGRPSIRLPDAEIHFFRQFVPESLAAEWFAKLMQTGAVQWRQDRIKMYGREVAIPRLNAWYGDSGMDYAYSGIPLRAIPWTSLLTQIRRRVEQATATRFNSVLINQYRDGRDSVAWHADDEPELGKAPVIASLSLGAVREFQLRHRNYRNNNLPVLKLQLSAGSLLQMAGATQECWQHRVPKCAPSVISGPRLNLTFRQIQSQNQ